MEEYVSRDGYRFEYGIAFHDSLCAILHRKFLALRFFLVDADCLWGH